MKILAAGRDTPSCGDLHQRFFTNNLLPLPVVGNDLDRHLSCTFIVDPGFMRRTIFFIFYYESQQWYCWRYALEAIIKVIIYFHVHN